MSGQMNDHQFGTQLDANGDDMQQLATRRRQIVARSERFELFRATC